MIQIFTYNNINFSPTNRQIFVIIDTHSFQSQFLPIITANLINVWLIQSILLNIQNIYQKYYSKSSLSQNILWIKILFKHLFFGSQNTKLFSQSLLNTLYLNNYRMFSNNKFLSNESAVRFLCFFLIPPVVNFAKYFFHLWKRKHNRWRMLKFDRGAMTGI